MVGLHEHPYRIASEILRHGSRSRAGTALEFVADHSRSAAHVALGDRPGPGVVQGLPDVTFLDVKAIAVIEIAVPGLRNHG